MSFFGFHGSFFVLAKRILNMEVADICLLYTSNRYARERMGHATENMLVNVYQHTFKDKHEEFDEALEAFFNILHQKDEE